MMNTVGTKFILAEQYIFDPNNNTLLDQHNEEEEFVRLGSNESRILLMFVQHPSEVIKRMELHDFVWRKQGFEVDDSSLTQAISTLRKILNDSTKSPQFIKTVPKRGYQFIASVEKTTINKLPDAPLLLAEGTESDEETAPESANQTNAVIGSHANENIDIDEGSPAESYVDSADLSHQTATSTSQTGQGKGDDDIADDGTPQVSILNSARHQSWSTMTLIFLIIALVLPFLAVSIGTPFTKTKFEKLTTFSGIPVEAPESNPELDRWLPSIEMCVKKYGLLHKGEALPVRIIATGGQEDQLSLNFIFSGTHSGQNTTFNILANNEELSKICR